MWEFSAVYVIEEFLANLTLCHSHKYLSLPLIPVEEFLELFPEHRETDEHELMIARINHEHAEREKLEQARQELLKRKQALIAENKKRKDDLASLDKDLERFIDVCVSSCRLCVRTLLMSIDDRQRSRFRKSSRRNTSEHAWSLVGWMVGGLLTATLDWRYWSRYPFFRWICIESYRHNRLFVLDWTRRVRKVVFAQT